MWKKAGILKWFFYTNTYTHSRKHRTRCKLRQAKYGKNANLVKKPFSGWCWWCCVAVCLIFIHNHVPLCALACVHAHPRTNWLFFTINIQNKLPALGCVINRHTWPVPTSVRAMLERVVSPWTYEKTRSTVPKNILEPNSLEVVLLYMLGRYRRQVGGWTDCSETRD